MELSKYHYPMDGFYNFKPEYAYAEIEEHWRKWDRDVKPKAYVVGISGGVDSTCAAAIAVQVFGRDKVVGVSLPCDGQKDMEDVDKAFAFLGIRRVTIDIGDMFMHGMNAIENQAIETTDVCRTNMPARLRMTMLYGVAQCLGGVVVNTCNLSEDVIGYSTFGGDNMGSYAPIKNLTKTEVKSITRWLEAPTELVEKTPIDGLQPLSDEEKLGITYAKIDDYIRGTGPVTKKEENLILDKFFKNKFKLEIIRIPGPGFLHYPNKLRTMDSRPFL